MDKCSLGTLPINAELHDKRMLLRIARVKGGYRDKYRVCGVVNSYVVPERNVFAEMLRNNMLARNSRVIVRGTANRTSKNTC